MFLAQAALHNTDIPATGAGAAATCADAIVPAKVDALQLACSGDALPPPTQASWPSTMLRWPQRGAPPHATLFDADTTAR